jgi:hypothetical protein
VQLNYITRLGCDDDFVFDYNKLAPFTAMAVASKSLHDVIAELYEAEWTDCGQIKSGAEQLQLLRFDRTKNIGEDILNDIQNYLNQFPEAKVGLRHMRKQISKEKSFKRSFRSKQGQAKDSRPACLFFHLLFHRGFPSTKWIFVVKGFFVCFSQAKVAKRNRKLVDFDGARYSLSAVVNAPKKNELKIAKVSNLKCSSVIL